MRGVCGGDGLKETISKQLRINWPEAIFSVPSGKHFKYFQILVCVCVCLLLRHSAVLLVKAHAGGALGRYVESDYFRSGPVRDRIAVFSLLRVT